MNGQNPTWDANFLIAHKVGCMLVFQVMGEGLMGGFGELGKLKISGIHATRPVMHRLTF